MEEKVFCVIDGPNGSGKTTVINNLSDMGYKTLSSPNGTPLAKMLRPACRGTEPWTDIHQKAQFMLFSAARLDEYIRCIHGEKDVVVSDRWWTSTYVYQCIYENISVDFLEHTIHEDEKIDIVILLDGDKETLIDRVEKEREENEDHGVCSWTQERSTMRTLIDIYSRDLPKYLEVQGIHYEVIDTTNKTPEEVTEIVEDIIEERRDIQMGE